MGVDVHILLPAAVRFSDVVTLVGVLAGVPFRRNAHFGWVEFPESGPIGMPSSIAEMANINVPFQGKVRNTSFHFESDKGAEWRTMIPRSNGFWCAIGKRLVNFFGGKVQYQDYNDSWDLEVEPKPAQFLQHNSNDEFAAFHDAMALEKPLSEDEIAEGLANSAYGVL